MTSASRKLKKKSVPYHLAQYISKQNYQMYSSIDHACWRYIMRVSKHFFSEHAHKKYLDGLQETGISIDSIPRISDMNKKLSRLGWGAVVVTGFIPPAVFLEFLSLGLLPIACDIRRLENLDYTPSPDIVHEAAGHAPIIADPTYAKYLHQFGLISRKAIFSKEDLDIYEAVKYLSDIKENPKTSPDEIELAYDRLNKALASVTYVSEAARLSRLGWWSTEYGLVKTAKGDFKIFGAGLLSSVGESYRCFDDKIPKIPLTYACTDVNFDITKPQPQLFYVEKFSELANVIEELSSEMAYRRGGSYGLEVARQGRTVTTTELDSGLQISGQMVEYRKDINLSDTEDRISFVRYEGPVQLSYKDKELSGHSVNNHKHGFSSPLGRLKVYGKSCATLTSKEIQKLGQYWEFESGILMEGTADKIISKNSKNLVIRFKSCKITYKNEVLYKPEWGPFDLACGEKVLSVFGGAADRTAFLKAAKLKKPEVKSQTSNVTKENKMLVPLYARIRALRAIVLSKGLSDLHVKELKSIFEKLKQKSTDDWLLSLEILELLSATKKGQKNKIRASILDLDAFKAELNKFLNQASKKSSVIETLIHRGLEII